MSRRVDHKQLVDSQEVVAAPAQHACEDQSFELPTGIYVAMGMLFVAFVAVLATAFRAHMGVSYGVVLAFLAAFFVIPAIFVKAAPHGAAKSLEWWRFRDDGIATATRRSGAGEAVVLVLILPVVILGFAIAIATIAAVIR
jgi:hypothetical protein